ncbi:hypothetical protein CDIK_3440, partial [Cucumispora dikerogammari]
KLKVNILNAIEIIVESWDKVTEKTINNCFSHAFFDRKEDSINEVCETSSEINTLSNIIHCVDKNEILPDVPELSLFEYPNIAAIVDELIDTGTVDEASVEDEPAVIVKPTLRDVESAVETLRLFLLTTEESKPEEFMLLRSIALKNKNNRETRRVQKRLLDFNFTKKK